MELIKRQLADRATYRRLVYLASALAFGPLWFTAIVTGWSVAAGLLATPFGIPALIGVAFATRGFAAVEAELARSLLRVDARAPGRRPRTPGFWAWFRSLFGRGFWRAQTYLLIRWFAGFPVAVALVALLASAVGMIVAPAWVPLVHGGVRFGSWRAHTLTQSLALVPVGMLLLPATLLLTRPLAAPFEPIAKSLLRGEETPSPEAFGRSARAGVERDPGLAVGAHAAVDAVVVFAVVLVWLLASRGYFWPVWIALPLATALGVHAWLYLVAHEPAVAGRFRGSRTLAASAGVGVLVSLFFTIIWALTNHGYFWPAWPMLVIAVVLAAQTAAAMLGRPGRAELTERIETLESTRAGAVDAQEIELRQIERDLHDGAQARLVALGMSLGMAEQKLSEDPQRAGELLAEARAGAEQALRELRDLARGIHPPVLTDRGLEAALASLASSTPLHVEVSVQPMPRPAPAVETAAYFVAAEALANAGKHARAQRVEIRIARRDDALAVEVHDDGSGGADPDGAGLRGLRRRVEALDGRLSVVSPRGGPTTVRAELPCG